MQAWLLLCQRPLFLTPLPTPCMSQTFALKLQETKPTLGLEFKKQPLTLAPVP